MTARRPRKPVFVTISELERVAAERTPPRVWEYVASGAGEETTLRANRAAFDRWSLVPRALRNVRSVDLSTELLGSRVAAPFFAAPTARHGAVHPGGEVATARALSRAGVLGVYSTLSSRSIEEIGRASGSAPRWFQLYLQPDVKRSIELVRRAERAGFAAWVVTVDAPILGPRDEQTRGGFAVFDDAPFGNGPHVRTPARRLEKRDGRFRLDGVADYTWETVDKVRDATDLPLVVKGILKPEDARAAVAHGAKALVVSNHGGRQLDRAVPALDALPAIARVVGRRTELLVDGGVRRASDILIALGLGARAAGIGRPVLWALAAGGEAGVGRLVELLEHELAISMVLLGRTSVSEIDRSAVTLNPTGDETVGSRARGRQRPRRRG